MKFLRQALGLPIYLLQALVILVQTFLFFRLSRLLHRGGEGIGQHIYWPIVVFRRIVEGRPRWQPIDIQIGKQPSTPEQTEQALLEGWRCVTCSCQDPNCKRMAWYRPDGLEGGLTNEEIANLGLLGAGGLTDEDLAEIDRLVEESAGDVDLPVADRSDQRAGDELAGGPLRSAGPGDQ